MKKRILIFGMNYAPELAGVGRYTGEIAEYLAGCGADVVVVTTPPHYPGWRVQASHATPGYSSGVLNGVMVHRCPLVLHKPMEGLWRLIAPLTFALSSAPVLLWKLITFRPDVAICVVPTMSGAPVLIAGARLVGARTVIHMHDLEADAAFAVGHLNDWSWLKSLARTLERWILKGFDKVITISDRMADRISEKGVDRRDIEVVRNWVDIDFIKPLEGVSPYRSELQFGPGDRIVLYSGNLGRKQGLDVLCQAAKRLSSNRNIHFVIAGEGPAKDILIERYGGSPNIHFLPFQPYERLSDFLGMADIHVLPQESNVADLVLPSKLGGMLASGKPIVVMADEDTELVHFLRDTAIVVRPGDIAELAEAIRAFSETNPSEPEKAQHRRVLATMLSKRQGLTTFAHAALEG